MKTTRSSSPKSVAALLQILAPSRSGNGSQPKTSVVPYLLLGPATEGSTMNSQCITAATATVAPSEYCARIQRREPSRSRSSRRQIFTKYWDRSETEQTESASAESQGHCPNKQLKPRSSTRTTKGHPEIDIRQYSPGPDYHCSLSEHHELLNNFLKQSGRITSTRTLPTLPDPLRRLVDESISSKGCGMYPLVSPKSILRKQKYGSRLEDDNDGDEENPATEQTPLPHPDRGFNSDLQISIRKFESNLKQVARRFGDKVGEGVYRQAVARQAQPSDQKSVHFDPRIVITEFKDRVERAWYTEQELLLLKNETIMLAHQYVLLNPQVVASLSKDSFDPITGKAKKQALFSLPILNSLPEDFNPEVFNKQLDRMLYHGVKQILVVDPNQAILQLFCKSISKMFPDANIVAVESGEEALRRYTMAMGHKAGAKQNRSFDIIVVEERLSRLRRRTSIQPRGQLFPQDQTASMPSIYGTSLPERKQTDRQSSLPSLDKLTRSPCSERRGMSGSQFIKRIRQLEDQVYGEQTTREESFRGVIIGVSANLEIDEDALKESGADMTWSKPPPPMGIQMRNQLLSALVSKRHGGCNVEMPQETTHNSL